MGATAAESVTPLEAARAYVRRGWCVVPIPYKSKRAVYKQWEQLRLIESELDEYFDQPANIGLILGKPSGGLVDVDLDCTEARAIADKYLPPTDAKTGRAGSANSHWWYIADNAETVQHRDPVTRNMIVELRSTGGQTVIGPSIHPTGQPYEILTGNPAVVPAEKLTACVAALAKRVIEIRHGESPPQNERPVQRPSAQSYRHESAGDVEQRALAYLEKMPPAISGQCGHSATYAAATVLVHGFEIDPDRALTLLLEHYNPRCEPPWDRKRAATQSHQRSDQTAQTTAWLVTESGD